MSSAWEAEEEDLRDDRLDRAEKIAYVYLAPVIVALGMFGCAANLVVLSSKRFKGRFFVYIKVSVKFRMRKKVLTCVIRLVLVAPHLQDADLYRSTIMLTSRDN